MHPSLILNKEMSATSRDNIADIKGHAPKDKSDCDFMQPPSREKLKISPEELANARLAPKCFVENYFYADVATRIAPGGVGKTTIILYEAICLALGRSIWGCEVLITAWTLYITAEDHRERLVARLREIMLAMSLSAEDTAIVLESVCFWDVAGSNVKLTMAADGNLQLTGLADKIIETYKSDPPGLTVLDPLVSFGVSEQQVNDNEQAIVTACRRIVRGLECCVLLVHHTGKAYANEKALHQYAGRGGSALADGARIVVVMQLYDPDESDEKEKTKLRPPRGCIPGAGVSVTILARPKLSYAPPNLPLIWIRREGFDYHWFTGEPEDKKTSVKANATLLLSFLVEEFRFKRYHHRTSLDDSFPVINMTRADGRSALNELIVSQKVVEMPLPASQRYGARKTFACPESCAAEFGGIRKTGAENAAF